MNDTEARYLERIERERDFYRAQRDELLLAAKSVVARWDSPQWKDEKPTAEYIRRLRNAIEKAGG